jgi:hypothetical protein
MEGRPNKEFGRRVPAPVQPAAPVKRSGHVALLLMGTFAVGGSAYGLMPRTNCPPPPPGMATPAASQAAGCSSQGSSYGAGHGGSGSYYSRRSFFSGDSPSGSSSSGPSSETASHSVTRGGFGSFAHAFSAHFSVGG